MTAEVNTTKPSKVTMSIPFKAEAPPVFAVEESLTVQDMPAILKAYSSNNVLIVSVL